MTLIIMCLKGLSHPQIVSKHRYGDSKDYFPQILSKSVRNNGWIKPFKPFVLAGPVIIKNKVRAEAGRGKPTVWVSFSSGTVNGI